MSSTTFDRSAAPTEFDHTVADLSTFGDDIDLRALAIDATAAEFRLPPPFWFRTIETLTPAKTVGLGRTNVTLIMATIVQTDAATPYAGFDRQSTPTRNPVAQVHFLPSAYGAVGPATYVVTFSIETSGPSTFTVAAPSIGEVSGTGSKSVNGRVGISVVFSNLSPGQPVYAYIEQTSGATWNWYATRISYPPLVVQL